MDALRMVRGRKTIVYCDRDWAREGKSDPTCGLKVRRNDVPSPFYVRQDVRIPSRFRRLHVSLTSSRGKVEGSIPIREDTLRRFLLFQDSI